MALAVLDRQSPFEDLFGNGKEAQIAGDRHSNQTGARGGLTLDDLITGVWEGLATHDTVCCPACGGAMSSRPTGRADAHSGDCSDCGAQLY